MKQGAPTSQPAHLLTFVLLSGLPLSLVFFTSALPDKEVDFSLYGMSVFGVT